MNQKWKAFKQELKEQIEAENKKTYKERVEKFYDFINPYTDIEIKYGSNLYYKISKKLTELGFREFQEQTLYQIIKSIQVPYKYINNNLVILNPNPKYQKWQMLYKDKYDVMAIHLNLITSMEEREVFDIFLSKMLCDNIEPVKIIGLSKI